jgi:CRISPR-associated endonuclease/helicase Cas3
MMQLTPARFPEFFEALHGHPPYSWQTRLAARAADGDWPGAIDLPTGSGKTACIDIAIFALACQASRPVAERTAPRRIFFCVNRRVIVDEAHERARLIAERLWRAEREEPAKTPVLASVAAALRQVAGTQKDDDTPPLDVLELRGGMYRDNRWARSVAQPTVVCTTLDQFGSRLLFRGYGVSPNAAPIQAALIAYDSLVFLDEAHISQPFLESLNSVRRYLDPKRWSEQSIGIPPMIVVPMTATPPPEANQDEVIRLDDEDRKNESLARRLSANKRASLHPTADVATAIVEHASKQVESGPSAVGIIVNRVATAKNVYHLLRRKHPDCLIELVIGAMRPIDRDEQAARLAPLVGNSRPTLATTTSITVATQCLEVGADYDFDMLITESASLDALRQRFGRLNRAGRQIEARAVIVVNPKEVKPDDSLDDNDPLDAIYANALARTWNWLWGRASAEAPPQPDAAAGNRPKTKGKRATETRTIDFGIDAFNSLLREHTADCRIPRGLLAPSANLHAPVMLPAYLDFWCQTSPVPLPDPDVVLFIHGSQRAEPDVQVCWRGDLREDGGMIRADWCDVVALLPPSAAECMSVPIYRVRRWLADSEDDSADASDLLESGARAREDENGQNRPGDALPLKRSGVLWRGLSESALIESPDELRPGDTLVLPLAAGGWNVLGFIPAPKPLDHGTAEASARDGRFARAEPPPRDVAESAFEVIRDKRALRLHPALFAAPPQTAGMKSLLDRVADIDQPPRRDELRDLMRQAAEELPADGDLLRERLEYFASPKNPFLSEPYPDGRGVVLTAGKRLGVATCWFLPALDDGDDDASRIGRQRPVTLADHTAHVVDELELSLNLVHTGISRVAQRVAAERHDWGKADERFQAWLRGTDRTDAWLSYGQAQVVLAKSAMPQTPSERAAARERAGLPLGFRHELVSTQLAERAGAPQEAAAEHDLILHLIAAHHGYGRPFAPVVLDENPPEVGHGNVVSSTSERRNNPPHRLDSGVGDRFWSLTRRYGWWGLAFLEALLRLADQQASADEDAGKLASEETPESDEANP